MLVRTTTYTEKEAYYTQGLAMGFGRVKKIKEKHRLGWVKCQTVQHLWGVKIPTLLAQSSFIYKVSMSVTLGEE